MEDYELNLINALQKRIDLLNAEYDYLIDGSKDLHAENTRLVKAILSIPEFIIYGNWDYKRCLFCKGKHKHKEGCIREELEKRKEV